MPSSEFNIKERTVFWMVVSGLREAVRKSAPADDIVFYLNEMETMAAYTGQHGIRRRCDTLLAEHRQLRVAMKA